MIVLIAAWGKFYVVGLSGNKCKKGLKASKKALSNFLKSSEKDEMLYSLGSIHK